MKAKKIAIMACAMAGITLSAFTLTSCQGATNSSDSTSVRSYKSKTYHTTDEDLPATQFFKVSVGFFTFASGATIDVKLDLSETKYTLTSTFVNCDGEGNPIVEGEPFYLYLNTIATGTYTEEDNQITISQAETVKYTVSAGSSLADAMLFACTPSEENGTLDSTDPSINEEYKTEILSYVPETTFTVNNSTITWEVNKSGSASAQTDESGNVICTSVNNSTLKLYTNGTAEAEINQLGASDLTWSFNDYTLSINQESSGLNSSAQPDNSGLLKITMSISSYGYTASDTFEIPYNVWSTWQKSESTTNSKIDNNGNVICTNLDGHILTLYKNKTGKAELNFSYPISVEDITWSFENYKLSITQGENISEAYPDETTHNINIKVKLTAYNNTFETDFIIEASTWSAAWLNA